MPASAIQLKLFAVWHVERMLGVAVCNCVKLFQSISNQRVSVQNVTGLYLSNVVVVFCVIPCTTVAYVFLRFSLYSCIDDAGACNFDITHASKKFALDSHNDNSLVNLAC